MTPAEIKIAALFFLFMSSAVFFALCGFVYGKQAGIAEGRSQLEKPLSDPPNYL